MEHWSTVTVAIVTVHVYPGDVDGTYLLAVSGDGRRVSRSSLYLPH